MLQLLLQPEWPASWLLGLKGQTLGSFPEMNILFHSNSEKIMERPIGEIIC